jgi:ATP-dependent Clp protease ATP-binding subunit ClpX
VPVVAPLGSLSQDALVEILTKPKNALVKQYSKYFKMEGVQIEFTKDAIKEVAVKAMKYKTGARALRSVMEHFMLDIMFKLPSMNGIEKCLISRDVVARKAEPKYIEHRRKRAQ